MIVLPRLERDGQTACSTSGSAKALENLASAFSTPAAEGPSKREKELVARTKELEAKLAKKDNVIAEVTEELVATKKRLGSPERPLGSP